MGWGAFFGKIADWFPGRKERYRAKIDELKRKMDLLVQQKSIPARRIEYDKLAYKLRSYEEKLRNL